MSFKTVKSQLAIITKTKKSEEPVMSQTQNKEDSSELSMESGSNENGTNYASSGKVAKSSWEPAVPRPQSPASQRPEELDPNVFVRINPAPSAPEVIPPPEIKSEPAPVENTPGTHTNNGKSAGTHEHVITVDTKSPTKAHARGMFILFITGSTVIWGLNTGDCQSFECYSFITIISLLNNITQQCIVQTVANFKHF